MSITVTILETGTIRIRPSHRCQRASRPVPLRRLRVLTDRRWTQPLPINTYLVDHPEGPILWDCGESPHAAERGFFPSTSRSSTRPSTSGSAPTRASARVWASTG